MYGDPVHDCSEDTLQTLAFIVHLSRLVYGTITLILTSGIIYEVLKKRAKYSSFFYTMLLLGGFANIPLFYLHVSYMVTINSSFCESFLHWWDYKARWHVPFFICTFWQTLLHMLIGLGCSLNRLTIVLWPGARAEMWNTYSRHVAILIVGLTIFTYMPLLPTTPYIISVPYFILDYDHWWAPVSSWHILSKMKERRTKSRTFNLMVSELMYSSSMTTMCVTAGVGLASFITTCTTLAILFFSMKRRLKSNSEKSLIIVGVVQTIVSTLLALEWCYRHTILYWMKGQIDESTPYVVLLVAVTTDALAFNSVWSLLIFSKELRRNVMFLLFGRCFRMSRRFDAGSKMKTVNTMMTSTTKAR